ncbi:MFS general substrate transporter [Myriangium duriaei CBS 260.36]|uniref:MFS general substrate transporter n=1 Tax=Myriangium duriaei CBS 260.36 TaxID=1168546 RepID=A0A9P4J1N1_9PEZI|nr:MFS general substrate transporter [Myriangium duriaei CBS 260.36]
MTRADMIAAIDALAADPDISFDTFAHINTSKLLRRIDLHIIPMLTLLYLLSYMDRSNIGNAAIAGLTRDLRMDSRQLNWCLTVYIFSYSVCEIPSNMILRKFRPSTYLPSIMVAWGVVLTLMGIVQSYHGLLIARVFLGVAEAGLFPGMVYFNTQWYRRYELQVRQAYFWSAASTAGAFSGLLAYGISFMDGVGSLSGWRWIFILEGLFTILIAFFSYFLLTDYPQTASFLSIEERIFLTHRLRYSPQSTHSSSSSPIPESHATGLPYILQALRDPQIYLSILIYWGYNCPLYGISLYLPSIVADLGYTSTTAQLMTVPIYASASLITILTAHLSDRLALRSPPLILGLITVLIGFGLCIVTPYHPGVTYAGLFIAAAGTYSCQAGNITWLANNLSGSYKRAVGIGMQIGLGNIGGAIAGTFYRDRDRPRYVRGHGLEMVMVGIGLVAAGLQVARYSLVNRWREKRVERGEVGEVEEMAREGDGAVTWRYTL